MDEEKKKYESGWNLAEHIILELSGLLQSASNSYVLRDYPKAFSYLRACRLRITPNLEAEEKNKLDKLELKLYTEIRNSKTNLFDNVTQQQVEAAQNCFIKYAEYNDLLMGYLKQYGYLIPPKKDKSRMNA